jgi:hypothetical protein
MRTHAAGDRPLRSKTNESFERLCCRSHRIFSSLFSKPISFGVQRNLKGWQIGAAEGREINAAPDPKAAIVTN